MIHWTRVLIDVLVLAVLFTVQQILTSSLIRPYQGGGFYCNDFSVNHEYKSSTVTNLHLILISLVSPLVILLFIEFFRTLISCSQNKLNNKHDHSFTTTTATTACYKLSLTKTKKIRIPEQLGNLCVLMGYFLFGLLATNLITNSGKLMIGRLRPNFLSVCKPNVSNPYTKLCQTVVKTYLVPDVDFKCMQSNIGELQDARKSFPSGHSSLSFYSMLFLALILNHLAVNFRLLGNLLFRFLQVFFVSVAFVVALSRVTDNKHHPTDVLSGGIIGSLCAFITYAYLLRTSLFRNYHLGPYEKNANLELKDLHNEELNESIHRKNPSDHLSM